ncbi:MAG: hypothetical protein LBL01_05175 [Bifidobacteriaceae bacterium]|nr:hypothetical protein [Bifidobacteriaceae bacterium]
MFEAGLLTVWGVARGRPAGLIVRRNLAVLFVAAGSGYLAGLAPLVVLAAFRATAGGPDLAVMASGLALLWAWTATGYLVGAWVRFPFSLAACLLAIVLIWWVPLAAGHLASTEDKPFSTASVASWWDFTVPVGWHETWAVAVFRICLFAAVAFAAGLGAVRVARPQTGVRWRDLARIVPPAAALPAALAVCGLWLQPAVMAPSAVDQVCGERGSVSACVEKETHALLEPLLASAADAVERFGPGLFDSASYSQDVGGYNRQEFVELRSSYSRAAALGVVGFESCLPELEEAAERGDPLPAEGPAVAQLLADEITSRLAGGPRPVYHGKEVQQGAVEHSVAAMTDQDLKDWIGRHQAELATCSTTAKALF